MTRKDIMKQPEKSQSTIQPQSFYERRIVPPANIVEETNQYTVHVDMPGVNKETVKLQVDADTLRIQGSTGDYHQENAKLHKREIIPTTYEREFQLGKEINRSKINAEYDNGVLTITLQKHDAVKPREIPIK